MLRLFLLPYNNIYRTDVSIFFVQSVNVIKDILVKF